MKLLETLVLLAICFGVGHLVDVAYPMQPLPLTANRTFGKLIWESEDDKTKMYRIVDHIEGLTVICYPLVGNLHGRTVSNFCIFKPSK